MLVIPEARYRLHDEATGPVLTDARAIPLRVRFSADTVADLDGSAENIGARLGRKIARSAVVRAIIWLCADKIELEDVPGLVGLFALDRVRRVRAPVRKGGAS